MIKAILAVGKNGEIGKNGDMPWGRGLPKDLEYFKEQTVGQIVVMGNNTFKSLDEKPLQGRDNRVLSSKVNPLSKMGYIEDGAIVLHNKNHLEACLKYNILPEDIYLIGGASVYKQFWNYVEEVHITRVKASFLEADTFFEPDLTGFEKVGEDINVSGEYGAFVEVWRRNS